MHLVLTDIVTCPACVPAQGLILLADRIVDRRVLEGRLGCPECRVDYPVRGGFADLRPRSAASDARSSPAAPERGTAEAALRLAALMGVTEGKGFSLVAGAWARLAPGVAQLVGGLEVVALDPSLRGWAEEPGVNRLAAEGRLPFFDSSLSAVALGTGWSDALAEGARVVSPVGRLVIDGAGPDAADRLREMGFSRVVREGDLLVAARH